MKKAKNIRIILLVLLSIVLLGCNKKDDDFIENDPRGGADHTYELKYIGGVHDGETIIGSIENNNNYGAAYGNLPTHQTIAIILFDESQNRHILVGIKREYGDVNIELNDSGEDEPGAEISIYLTDLSEAYGSESGTLTISNFQTYQAPGIDGGPASLTANFTGQFTEAPSNEMVQIIGKITANPPRP